MHNAIRLLHSAAKSFIATAFGVNNKNCGHFYVFLVFYIVRSRNTNMHTIRIIMKISKCSLILFLVVRTDKLPALRLFRFPPTFVAVFEITSLSLFSFRAVALAGATTVFDTVKLRWMFTSGSV